MKIVLSVLLIILIVASSGVQSYYLMKRKDFKTLFVQMAAITLAIVGGILAVYEMRDPSMAKLLGSVIPWW